MDIQHQYLAFFTHLRKNSAFLGLLLRRGIKTRDQSGDVILWSTKTHRSLSQLKRFHSGGVLETGCFTDEKLFSCLLLVFANLDMDEKGLFQFLMEITCRLLFIPALR